VPNDNQADANRNGVGDACDAADGGPISVRTISPESGPAGTVVRIRGSGFSTTGYNFVLFDGLPVGAAQANASELAVTVPAGVAPGPVHLLIGTDKGFAMSPMPFILRRSPAAK
jgi:IPT/TIG domain